MNNLPVPSQFDIQLLGAFQICFDGELVHTVTTPRLQSLLAYFVLHSNESHSRRHLAFLLWPDSNEDQALTNLRKHLMHLKQALPNAAHLLAADRHTVRWLNQIPVHCDIVDFRTLLSSAKANDRHITIAILQQAVDLYKGDLLPGCYDEWLLPIREALHADYLSALEQLSALYEEERNYNAAIHASQQLLRLDSLHEATYRRLIRLYALNEDRAAALRIYHTCVTQLREELGVDPDAETQATYERLLNGASVTPVQPEMAAHAPFVGRQNEWQSLQNRWRLAVSGTPQFVLIAGEAGIGKTRLAEELLGWATHQGFCTVRSRCYAAEGRLTYAPIIEWLRSDPIRLQRNKIAATWLTELARLLPEILNDNPNLPPPEPITQSAQRHHLFEAATRTLLASDQPLILLIDDLQWCDKETLELLHFLLRNAPTLSQTKVMLIGTARLPDEVDDAHPLYELLNPLRGSNHLTQLDLVRLSASETSSLARQMVEDELDASTLQQLFKDTDGNPLFVVELMRSTQGQPLLNGALQTIASTAIQPIEASEIIVQQLPPKVLAVIQARLGQLSPTARELCEWAAIVGRSFTLDLLVDASKITQDKAVNALDELWQRRIIREHSSDAYDFSHDRIRDVAGAGVSRVRRKYLHKCVAEALETQGANQVDNGAAIIAVHFEAAGMIEKAVHCFGQAAYYTQLIFAPSPTVVLLERALKLVKTLPVGYERDVIELKFLVRLSTVLANVTGYTTTNMIDVIEQTYTLSKKLHISPSPTLMRLLAIYRLGIKTHDQVQELATSILNQAQGSAEVPDNVLVVEGWYIHGVNEFWHGNFVNAKECLQNVLTHYSVDNYKRHIIEYAYDTGSYCRVRLGLTLWYLGYPDQALKECEAGIESSEKIEDPNTIVNNLAHILWLHCERRNSADERRTLEKFATQSAHIPTIRREVFLFLEGWHHYQCERYQSAVDLLADYVVVRDLRRADSLYRNFAFVLLARTYCALGDFENAHIALMECEAFYDGQDDWWNKAEFYGIKGDLLIAQGKQIDQAEACFQQALSISRRQQAKSLELRAAMSLARLWNSQGKRKEAKELLAGIYNWFTEGFATADLQDARVLLAELSLQDDRFVIL